MLLLVSKLSSWLIYLACWRNALDRDLRRHGPIWHLVSRVWLWPIHGVVLFFTAQVSWAKLDAIHQVSVVSLTLLAIGAIFRFGSADRRCFFAFDRIAALMLTVGACFSPALVYPAILACCCLQYTVSSWPLSPGYSNLLGFEFIRGTCCAILVGVTFCGIANVFPILGISAHSDVVFMVVVAIQASSYLNHALAKSALGPSWYSWIFKNRVECLLVNSYLRGWAAWIGQARLLRLASLIARFRVPMTGSAWILEAGFPLVLIDPKLAAAFYLCAAAFHLGLFVMTGLLELEYVVNHVNLSILLIAGGSHVGAEIFGIELLLVTLPLMLLIAVWVGWLRMRILAQRRDSGSSSAMFFADPFDHLMAWWDSPYMRMFSYFAVTADGDKRLISVPKLSPYDTFLTDIHTHIMLLDAHPEFDEQSQPDKQLIRTGVWGMVITNSERELLYQMMDQGKPDLSLLMPSVRSDPWRVRAEDQGPSSRIALRELFAGINELRHRSWFRLLMRYPHFPGEDLAPDGCPLTSPDVQRYLFDEEIETVVIERVKTFYTGDDILLIDQSEVGVLEIKSRDPVASESKGQH